jgi:hypothetical protein
VDERERAETIPSTTSDDPVTVIAGFSQACYLWFRGFEILEQWWEDENSPRPFARWSFKTTPELEGEIRKFDFNNAKVDPMLYFPKVTEFKRMTYRTHPDPKFQS